MAVDYHPRESRDRRLNLAWLVLAALAAFYLWTEHQAHLLGALPYLLLLACPLMHLFMHRGHRHHDGDSPRPPKDGNEGTP